MDYRHNDIKNKAALVHDLAYWGLLIAAAAVFLVMNFLTTLKEDDMLFSLVEGEWTPVRTLMDAVRSHIYHYGHTNGRLADVVPEFFCGLAGKAAFNVCNTLVFAALLHLLSLLVTGRRSVLMVALFLAMVGTCFPVPGETMLWIAGSAGYMWAITLSLALVWYLQRQHSQPIGAGAAVVLFLCALVAGGFNEATSFGFFGGLCAYYAFNRKRCDRRAMVALTGYLLGIVLIAASPGAWDRAAAGGIAVDMPLGDLLASRWFIFHEKMWRFLTPVAALLVGIVALLLRHGGNVRCCVWTYIALALALVVFILGIIHERVYAPLAVVTFIIVAMAAHWLLSRQSPTFSRQLSVARVALTVVALGLATFTFARGIKVMRQYQAFYDETVAQIVAAPRQAVLPMRSFDTYSRFIKPVNFNSTNFFAHEVVYCAYFGKENVQFVPYSIYTLFHEGRLLDGAVPLPMHSDRPDLTGTISVIPEQGYFTVELKTDTFPHSFQTARYCLASSDELSQDEMQRRVNYGLTREYNPMGFFPLRYQGRILFVLPVPTPDVSRIVIPLGIDPGDPELTLTPRIDAKDF